jgi:uncharacterized paraquat-inducible protein A
VSVRAIICPNCGAKTSAERSRCPRCRAELRPAPVAEAGTQHSKRMLMIASILLLAFAALITYLWYTGVQ